MKWWVGDLIDNYIIARHLVAVEPGVTDAVLMATLTIDGD